MGKKEQERKQKEVKRGTRKPWRTQIKQRNKEKEF